MATLHRQCIMSVGTSMYLHVRPLLTPQAISGHSIAAVRALKSSLLAHDWRRRRLKSAQKRCTLSRPEKPELACIPPGILRGTVGLREELIVSETCKLPARACFFVAGRDGERERILSRDATHCVECFEAGASKKRSTGASTSRVAQCGEANAAPCLLRARSLSCAHAGQASGRQSSRAGARGSLT